MTAKLSRQEDRGFTLVETMAALAVSSMILLAVTFATVAYQKVFIATDEYYKATSDEARVLDYIALDMRRATSGSVTDSGQTLTLRFPDYIDYSQNPPVPRTPTVSATSKVIYGTAGVQPTVVYSLIGSQNTRAILRTLTPTSGAPTVTTLTSGLGQLQFRVFDPAKPNSTADFSIGGPGEPQSITAQLTFMPRFTRQNLSTSRRGTRTSMTTSLRNLQ